MALKKMALIVLLCAAVFVLAAQTNQAGYDKKWKTVDSLVSKKGLTQSALAEVGSIYILAKKEKNAPQVIKSLLYRMSLSESVVEEAGKKNIAAISEEAGNAVEPSRSILLSIEASMYLNYFQQHRYQLYKRTPTIHFEKADIDSWDAADFHKKIASLFLTSIEKEKLLQQTTLAAFDAILQKGDVRHLRPTLYDLLVHRALDYFKNDERDVEKPAYAFEINDSLAFAPAPVFSAAPFITHDSLSLQHKALQLFQRLLIFHSGDAAPDALLDADLERLSFAREYSTLEEKDSLYLYALQQITRKYGSMPQAAQAWYLQAQLFKARADGYNYPQDTVGRNGYVQAKAICEKVIAEKDSSEGRTNCLNLLDGILQKELEMHVERVNVPGKPFRMLVDYRNLPQAYFRLVKMDHAIKETIGRNQWEDDYWKKLLLLPTLKTFSQALPATSDFQKHHVEIKVDALPAGDYALLASTHDFNATGNALAVHYFYVSSIAYINKGNDYFVVDRETGHPKANATAQVWKRYADDRSGKVLYRKTESYQADAHGFFQAKRFADDSYNAQLLELQTADDHLFLEEDQDAYHYVNPSSNDELAKPELTSFLFTDRSIYRPGQTLYFKGIVVSKDAHTGHSVIMPGFPTKIFLYDANENKVDSLALTTNVFGSYHGQFSLPATGLAGDFKITDDSTESEQRFSVEEYKRPTFNLVIDKPANAYRLRDTVRLSGTAMAYAGNTVTGAVVNYHVMRQTPYWNPAIYGSYGRFRSNSREIAHGQVSTGADGKFNIAFVAIPDAAIPKSSLPVFEYAVTADVTDKGGETRSGTITLEAGYAAIQLRVAVSGGFNLRADSLRSVVVAAENSSGVFQSVPVRLRLIALKAPDRLIRQRYWAAPDQFVMDRNTYLSFFPYDEYATETNKDEWERTTTVFDKSITLKEHVPVSLDGTRFASGWYVLETTATDGYGQPVKTINYVSLTDPKTGNLPSPQYNWVTTSSKTALPGSGVTITTGSSSPAVWVIRQEVRPLPLDDDTVYPRYTFFEMGNAGNTSTLRIAESDRGGFGVLDVFVKNNRIYTSSTQVDVPWTNKQLTISYTTFRDKTLPGSNEKWTMHLSGLQRDKLAAEVLTAMYDASLDQFKKQEWTIPGLYTPFYMHDGWNGENNFAATVSVQRNRDFVPSHDLVKIYDQLVSPSFQSLRIRGMASPMLSGKVAGVATMQTGSAISNVVVTALGNTKRKKGAGIIDNDETGPEQAAPENKGDGMVQVRKNFKETAFFFPDLQTDSAGNVQFSFTMPEAVTEWKWMTLAHTKDLAFGYAEKMIVTQKQLMAQPNTPRFLREGDHIEISTRIVNLGDTEMTGQASLQLIDPATNQPVDGWFQNMQANQYFTVGAKQTGVVAFPLQVPYQYSKPVTCRITVQSGKSGDGEETVIPVLSNRMLVTESLPLVMQTGGTKHFTFDALLHSGNSETLNHHALTFEFTSNPSWYAVQALPYLMEFPYECAEQTFNRFYANAIAAHIVASAPVIKTIFEKWKTSDTAALVSNLEKNPELKNVLLEETPWVAEAGTESARKKRIAMLFEMARMASESAGAFAKLQEMQSQSGGFAWFKDGPDDRFITQYILTGIGHLQKLHALPDALSEKIDGLVRPALDFLDKKITQDYQTLLKRKTPLPADQSGPDQLTIQYLYMRSFFSGYAIPGAAFPAVNYYRKQSQQNWLHQNKYLQGMIALSLFQTGDIQKAKDILASLKQNAVVNEETGMYWKAQETAYYWYQAPVEMQSLMIEAFQEILHDTKTVDRLKTWLLMQKQTQNWGTTKSTADACYALLLSGTDWLLYTPEVQIKSGDKIITGQETAPMEAGTGYVKKTVEGAFVNAAMGNITVTIPPSPAHKTAIGPAWGAVYWQYFENLDHIANSTSPLQVTKKLFIEKRNGAGAVLEPLADNDVLHTGDKVIVRIELKTSRDLEYVHLKDLRAACMEPVQVLSGYTWQSGLGYYSTTGDAGMHFFFNWLPKGTHIFEYPLFAGMSGNFSNGITTVQCMYAPEFTAHSEGIRVTVEP